MTARCLSSTGKTHRSQTGRPHTPPAPESTFTCESSARCGIYGMRERRMVPPQVGGPPAGYLAQARGIVKLWGIVIPYERGWRAQYAYPARIDELHTGRDGVDLEEVAADLADSYGIEVSVR